MKPHTLTHSMADCSRMRPPPTLPPQDPHWLSHAPAYTDDEVLDVGEAIDPDVETNPQNRTDEGLRHHSHVFCGL